MYCEHSLSAEIRTCGVAFKVLDCAIIVGKFEIHFCLFSYFSDRYEPPFPASYYQYCFLEGFK